MNNLPNSQKTTWTTDELISLTKQHWQRGEFQKVETICNDLLRQAQGQEANVFWLVGLISYEIAQPNMAIKFLSESVKRVATPEKYRILATVYFDFKQFEAAFSCLRNALELQPSAEEGEKIFLLLLNCREYIQDFSAWRDLGLFYLKAKIHSHYKAFYCFRRALDIQPDSAEAYSLLVEAAKGNGEFYAHFSNQSVDKEDTQGLADLYFTALLGSPYHPAVSYHPREPSWVELANIYLYIQQYEIAFYFLSQAITVKLSVELSTKLLICSEQLNDCKKWHEAVSYYQKAKVASKDSQNTLVLGHIQSVKNWCEINQLKYHKILPAQIFMIKKPKHIIGNFMPVDEGVTFSNELYVAEIPNARIFYRNNLVVAGQTLLYDRLVDSMGDLVMSQDSVCKSRFQDNLLIDYSEFSTLHAECGILMSGLASQHFGHWIWEYLPKWRCYEHISEYQDYPIYVDADMPKTHYEALRILVGNDRKIVQIPANTSVVFGKLIVAPTPTFMPTNLKQGVLYNRHIFPNLPPVLNYLQSRLSSATGLTLTSSDKGCRRIYLSRRKMSTWRMLLNEQEIVSFLKNIYGFEEVFLEEMSFLEQMKTLNSANFVVAPRGSAMCHLLFCKKRCKIILLMNEVLANFSSFSTSFQAIGYPHWIVCGTSEGNLDKHANFHISLTLLKQAIEDCLSS